MEGFEPYEQGHEAYPLGHVVLENGLLALWIGIGTFLTSAVSMWLGIAYAVGALVMILVVLRRLICANCWYYGKVCHVGWGKLAALVVRRGDPAAFAGCSGMKVAPAFYGALALIPLVAGVVAVILWSEARLVRIVALVLLVLVAGLSSTVVRKRGCMHCKMRRVCPGTAAPLPLSDPPTSPDPATQGQNGRGTS